MNKKEFVRTASEWIELEELPIPTTGDSSENGAVYQVLKAGFVLASLEDCAKHNIEAEIGPGGKCVLPTAVVDINKERQLRRLPLELASWAFDMVALAQSGINSFPTRVEFGILDGRTYAEML